MKNCNGRIDRPRKGQALVELAIVVPFFILMLTTVIDFGLMWQAKLILTRLGRDAGQMFSARTDVTWTQMKDYLEGRKPTTGAWQGQTVQWLNQREWLDDQTNTTMREFNLNLNWPLFTPLMQSVFGEEMTLSTATSANKTLQFSRGT